MSARSSSSPGRASPAARAAPRSPPICPRRRARSRPRGRFRRRRASRAAPRPRRQARRAGSAGAPPAASSACPLGAKRGDFGRDCGVVGLGGGAAQDQAQVGSASAIAAAASAASAARRPASRSPRAMFRPGASGVRIAVRPFRRRPLRDRRRLAGFGPAGDLNQKRTAGRGQPLAAQEAGAARRRGRASPPPSPSSGEPATAR